MPHFREVSLNEFNTPAFSFGHKWAILSAGAEGSYNGMTVSWGQFGELWGHPVVTVYVRPQRHTLKFMEESEYFTLSFFPEEQRAALRYFGAKSGRDGDKASACGLIPIFDRGSVWYEQAEQVLLCRKLYRQELAANCFLDKSVDEQHYDGDYHVSFIGEVVACLRAE